MLGMVRLGVFFSSILSITVYCILTQNVWSFLIHKSIKMRKEFKNTRLLFLHSLYKNTLGSERLVC